MIEVWKEIEGFKNYQVSNFGNVKSVRKEKLLKLEILSKGYLRVCLTATDILNKRFLVHRLVASAFIPNPDNKAQVNHKDGDKANNCVENLEWCTNSENILHAFSMGLNTPRKGNLNGCFGKHGLHRISVVKLINPLTREITCILDLAKKLNLSESYICKMLKGVKRNKTGFIYYKDYEQEFLWEKNIKS